MKFKAQMTCIGKINKEFSTLPPFKKVSEISIWCSHHALELVFLHDAAWSQTFFKCLLVAAIPYCLNAQPKFVFWSLRIRITFEKPTNQISNVLNRRHFFRICKPRKKLHVLRWNEVSNSFCNMWACNILLKGSSRDA